MTETDSRLEELGPQKSILFDDEGPQCICGENSHSARAYQRHAPRFRFPRNCPKRRKKKCARHVDSQGARLQSGGNTPKLMKSLTLKLLVPALFVATCAHLQARFVTLSINPQDQAAELTILSNEVATVRSTIGSFYGSILKDGTLVDWAPFSTAVPVITVVIAGPAYFRLTAIGNTASFCTIEITPDSPPFPPDKTLIIPQGTGANITFERSTNLLDWNPVWQGTYTNSPSNKFFRIRADRLP